MREPRGEVRDAETALGGFVVFTHDLDFGVLIAMAGAAGPIAAADANDLRARGQ